MAIAGRRMKIGSGTTLPGTAPGTLRAPDTPDGPSASP